MTLLGLDVHESRSSQVGRMSSPAPTAAELTTALRNALLDPECWREPLGQFARATNLAVVLADDQGRLLGESIHPLSSRSPSAAPRSSAIDGCPFSPAQLRPCFCVRDALNGRQVVAWDGTGLMHFAVALSLGEHRIGVLLAGESFDRAFQRNPSEIDAATLDPSFDEVRGPDRRGHPAEPTTLHGHAELLVTLGQTSFKTHDRTLWEAEHLAEMTRLCSTSRRRSWHERQRVEDDNAFSWKPYSGGVRFPGLRDHIEAFGDPGRALPRRLLSC